MTSQIGFVGLGIMGRGMVKNLAEKNHSVTVWNRTPEKSEALKNDLGVNIAPSLQSLAKTCDTILICVSDTPDVEAVLFGEKTTSTASNLSSTPLEPASRTWAPAAPARPPSS